MADINNATPPSPREPGEDGTTVGGQIDTPMCSTNVGKKGDTPGTHSYADTMHLGNGGDVSIVGPGAKGIWDTQIKISGNNQKKY